MSNTVPKPVVNNLPVRSRKRPPLSTDINGTPAADSADESYEAALNVKIEHLDLDMLKPPPIELRKHSPRQIHLLKKSVQAFGVVKPALIDRDSVIVAGYGVYRAAKALKHKSMPVVRLEHLSPELIRMYRLMDNQSAMLGENDAALVRLELEELSGISLKFNLDLELNGEFYLLHLERARMEAPDLRHRIEALHRQYGADRTLIEDDGVGRAIVQDLRRTSQYCLPLLVKPQYEKLARMEARAVMFETGKVLVPSSANWLNCYLEELLSFPNCAKDDQVDSTSQALDYLQRQFAATLRGRPQGRKRPKGGPRPLGAPHR